MTAAGLTMSACGCVLAAALAGCGNRPVAPSEPPLVRFTAHEFEFGLPDTVPAGLVRVRLVNDGTLWHAALFVRLDSTQTPEGYLREIRAGSEFPSHAVDFGGHALTAPGDSADVVMRFEPGRWLAMCSANGGGAWHVRLGMVDGFVVAARATASDAPPPDDGTLVMRDGSFEFPDSLTPGVRWVRIENHGQRWHEVDVLRLEPGKDKSSYERWRTVEHQMLPGPCTPIGGAADFGPGVVQWSRMDLRPGRHMMVCDMPGDSAEVRYFEVTGAR